MRLAIYIRENPVFSETFLMSQLNGLGAELIISGIPFATEASNETFYPPRSLPGIISMLWARGISKRSAIDVQRSAVEAVLRRKRISILLVNYGPEAAKFLNTCRKLRIPLVTHFHGYDAHMSSVLEEYAELYRKLGEDGNRIIAVSNVMRSKLEELGVPPESVEVIRYGVDPKRFSPRISPPEDPVFFSVGRFTDKKAPYLRC